MPKDVVEILDKHINGDLSMSYKSVSFTFNYEPINYTFEDSKDIYYTLEDIIKKVDDINDIK